MLTGLGDTEISGYDPAGRLTTLVGLNAALHPISTIISYWDAGGRKTGDLTNGVLATYTLDNGGRMLGQQKAGEYSTFAYDSLKNMTLEWYQGNPPLTMAYDAASRLGTAISGSTVTTVTSDNAGNRTVLNVNGALTSFSYDPENREIKIVQPSGALSTNTWQLYDGLRRTKQEPGTPLYTAIWDDQANQIGEVQ
jgi:hypothetical protein